ncbi:hypothetical protein M9H77_31412 [Catharanthus roseus]|uniref:Uncharacterized protein n=1 Tax=Catharanthus roseus TaxID=4058 RepID=A0ACC0A117_CATRO|nr:hypothetical protein M9H77_31412 [Catharanthus roseus]
MYTQILHIQPTVGLPSFSSSLLNTRTLDSPIFKEQSTQNSRTRVFLLHHYHRKLRPPLINCSANSEGVGSAKTWEKWLPRNFLSPDKVFEWISEATSSPIAQYISSPTTFLHSVDPRIKLAWLLALVVLPARSHIFVRFALVAFLALLSILMQPRQVWVDQLGRVTLLCTILFIMVGLSTDSAPSLIYSRTPPPSMMGLPNFPTSLEGYSYIVMRFGPLLLTRKGLSAASTAACLAFTIFQSASLCLTSTTPEQLAFALQWFINPLGCLGFPVGEVILTLLLSLRFISLVFDEVRSVALGIVSRRINWQLLTTMETIDVFVTYIRRIFRNIFGHAEQISQAMIVRGFRGDSNSHKISLSTGTSSTVANCLSLLCLLGLTGATAVSRYYIL